MGRSRGGLTTKIHALVDALLGTVGAGDIGTHFPDTDAQFKGADSGVLLAEAARRALPAARVVTLPDATHFTLPQQHPAEVNGMLREMIKTLDDREATILRYRFGLDEGDSVFAATPQAMRLRWRYLQVLRQKIPEFHAQ